MADRSDWVRRSSSSFRGGRPPRRNDVFVAVMGVTGSGKSSFIARCSGKPVRIGHNLSACTSTVDVYAYDMSPHRTVYLIDTPGFDDTTRSDAEVLSEIATWLGDSYQHKILLSGIIYLHRITDLRMQGSARRNLRLFRQLCGQDALKKVVLVTTMWDQIAEAVGRNRETELVETNDFWGWMVRHGSSYYRHNDTPESAVDIIHRLSQYSEVIITDIQRELVDDGRRLNETSAGRELESDLIHQKKKFEEEYDDMEEQRRVAVEENDAEGEEVFREDRDSSAGAIEKVKEEISSLRLTMENLIAQRDDRVASIVKAQLRERDASYQDTLEQIRQQTQRLEVGQESRPSSQHETEAETQSLATSSTIDTPAASVGGESRYSASKQIQQDWCERSKIHQSIHLPEDSPVTSVSMWDDVVCIIGDHAVNSTGSPKLKLNENSAFLRRISFGDAIEGSRSWIACYEKSWMASDNLGQVYPTLGQGIELHGIETLEFCFLGPYRQFIAKWNDGNSRSSLPTKFPKILEGHDHIVDVAFGWKYSCFVVYVPPGGGKSMYFSDLKDYYPDLRYFLGLKENKKILILAITLDPTSTTDYILVYTNPSFMSKKGRQVRFYCSNQSNAAVITNVWPNTALKSR